MYAGKKGGQLAIVTDSLFSDFNGIFHNHPPPPIKKSIVLIKKL